MKPNLNDIKKHLAGIPDRRLPLGKNAWLQEWQEIKELVESFEKQLQEMLTKSETNTKLLLLKEQFIIGTNTNVQRFMEQAYRLAIQEILVEK